MNNANQKHADVGYRTLLVHAQYANMKFASTNLEEVIVDLMTSLMHLQKDYGFDIETMVKMAKERFETLTKCPQCNGVADRGIDNCIPPGAYMCSQCCAQEETHKAALVA